MKRYAIATAITLIVSISLFSSSVGTQTRKPKNQKPFNLQGKWDDAGDVVNITQKGATVTAKWEKWSSCKHGATEESLQAEFKATLVGNKLTGEAKYCNYGDELAKGIQWGRIELTVSSDGNTLSAIQYMKNVTKSGTREVKVDYVMKRSCDSNLWADYERKKKTAEELFEAGNKMGEEIVDEAHEYMKEQLIGFGEVGAVKGPPLHYVETVRDRGLEQAERYRGSLATAYANGSKVTGAVITGAEIGGIGATALWITQMGQKTLEFEKQFKVRKNMGAQGVKLLESAFADYEADFNQSAPCREELKKMEAEKRLRDEAHELMESWDQSPNGNLYRDPYGQILDSAAAFKRAKEILSKKSSGSLFRKPDIQKVALTSASNPQDIKVSLEQLAAALAEIDRGISSFRHGMDELIQMLNVQENNQRRTTELLSHFGNSTKVGRSMRPAAKRQSM
ncbi:MAG: hypothetical protein ACREBG_19620 [Pyrinomonadaceae bacterium]